MLTNLAIIFILGLIFGELFKKLNLPALLGMVIAGIVLGSFFSSYISPDLINISADLRELALVIILTRAGLTLKIDDLKRVGRPAFMMCFIPALFEIAAVIIIGKYLFKINTIDAAIIGSVIAAVSPAVIVPRMITIIKQGYGKEHSIPQLILAGASVDDVFVITLFTSFTALATGNNISALNFISIPLSIVIGIFFGIAIGIILNYIFKKINVISVVKVIITLSISFLIIECEDILKNIIPFSALLAIMSMSMTIKKKNIILSNELSIVYNKLWLAAEILLFVLVGMTVNLSYVLNSGLTAIFIVISALSIRMLGVLVCFFKTNITVKERIFCMLSYTPKATVQAAIGSIPLSMGLACGEQVLTVAVLSILITAPFGAICIDKFHKKLLSK